MFPNNRRYTENRTKSDLPSSFILEYQNDELMIMFTLLYVQVLSRAVSTVLEDIKIVLSTKRKPVALLLILFIIISSRSIVVHCRSADSAEEETIFGSVMDTLFSVELCVSTAPVPGEAKYGDFDPCFMLTGFLMVLYL